MRWFLRRIDIETYRKNVTWKHTRDKVLCELLPAKILVILVVRDFRRIVVYVRKTNENKAIVDFFFPLLVCSSGRHRCIGENFAYVQIKTIWSTLLRLYEFDLADGYFPTINYTTMIHTPHKPIIRYKRRLQ